MQSFVPWAVGLHTLVQQGRGGCRGSCGDLLGSGVRGRASGGEQTQGCPGGCGGWGAAVRRGQQHFALGLLGLAWHSSVRHGMAQLRMAWHSSAHPKVPPGKCPEPGSHIPGPQWGALGWGAQGNWGGDPWKCHRCRRPRCPLWQQREGKAAPWDPDPCPGASWGEKAA